MKKLNKSFIKIHMILILTSIIFVAILVLSGYSVGKINNYENNVKYTIEQQKRSDARILLKDAIDRFDYAIKIGQVNPTNEESVNKWASYNFSGLRNGSATSNGFIVELGEEVYVSDSSVNYNTIFKDPARKTIKDEVKLNSSTKEAFKKIKLGIDSSLDDNVSCSINGENEWLEWANYPTAISVGIQDEPIMINGSKNSHYKKYVFIIRTKEDEIFKSYETIFSTLSYIVNIIYILLGVLLFVIICAMFYLVYLEQTLKWCKRYNNKENNNS